MLLLLSLSTHPLLKQAQQLEKQGNITHTCLNKPEELEEALNSFLDLEASGWKGRKRTALKSSPQGCAFAQDALRLSKGNISCRYDFMAVDGKIIASGDEAWDVFLERLDKTIDLFDEIKSIQVGIIGSINYEIEELRLAQRRLELDGVTNAAAYDDIEQKRSKR
ncbi:MAG: hypothetical protein L3J76_04365, partial [Candidatus Hydrothermae bacterium]|nr:hypothetical protein [Candidatus Hydrothermae bacterium]